MPPPRLTRMRAPLRSISISVRPVSFSSFASSRTASASALGFFAVEAGAFLAGAFFLELISSP